MRLLDISIDLIHRIPVTQRSLQHKRARIIHYSGRIQRSINQYLIDLAPGNIITEDTSEWIIKPYSRADVL